MSKQGSLIFYPSGKYSSDEMGENRPIWLKSHGATTEIGIAISVNSQSLLDVKPSISSRVTRAEGIFAFVQSAPPIVHFSMIFLLEAGLCPVTFCRPLAVGTTLNILELPSELFLYEMGK